MCFIIKNFEKTNTTRQQKKLTPPPEIRGASKLHRPHYCRPAERSKEHKLMLGKLRLQLLGFYGLERRAA